MENNRYVVILLAPSAGGKDTVIDHLTRRGIIVPCVRETTRPVRPGDNGHYCFVGRDEFERRQAAGQYTLVNKFGGELYAVPFENIECLLASGQTPVIKGTIFQVEDAKRCLSERLGVTTVTIELIPKPMEKWLEVIKRERYDNCDGRIADSLAELAATSEQLRHLVDDFIDNVYGQLDETVAAVETAIRRHQLV